MTTNLDRFAELMGKRLEGTWHFKGYDEDTIYVNKRDNDWAIVRGATEYDGPAICAAVNLSDAFVALARAVYAAVENDLEWEKFDYKTYERVPEADGVHTRKMQQALADLEKLIGEELGTSWVAQN